MILSPHIREETNYFENDTKFRRMQMSCWGSAIYHNMHEVWTLRDACTVRRPSSSVRPSFNCSRFVAAHATEGGTFFKLKYKAFHIWIRILKILAPHTTHNVVPLNWNCWQSLLESWLVVQHDLRHTSRSTKLIEEAINKRDPI